MNQDSSTDSGFGPPLSSPAAVSGSISRLLGGDEWKSQEIGEIGKVVETSSFYALQLLKEAVEVSLKLSPSSDQRNGLFNSVLVEALVQAVGENQEGREQSEDASCLNARDFKRAGDLLKAKLKEKSE